MACEAIMRFISYLVPGAFLALTCGVAQAQTDLERATARDAANSGRQAFDAGQYEKAIDSFTRAESLVHAPPHLLFLARAQVKLGRLVAAHETYTKITRESLAPNAPKAFVDAHSAAESEQTSVDARLPSVTVTLQGAPASGVVVDMDGTNLPAAMIGIPLPADPGLHTFKTSGTATGDPVTITLAEAAKQTVVLKVHSSGVPAAAPGTAPAAVGVGNTDATTGPLVADAAPGSGTSGLRIASYVSFGVGAVGAGVGTFFLLKSKSSDDDAGKLFDQCVAISRVGDCGPIRQQYESKQSDVDSQRNIGVASLIVGGVGVAAGVTFLILDLSSSSKSASNDAPRVIPVVGLNTLGLAGTF